MKILIADDDPQILRALRITLRARGYDVVTAADGTGAINAAVEEKPDLLMVDLGMPGMGGLEVIEAVRGWSSAPILVVSGRTGSADKVEALDAGADDYVTKPFAIDELLVRNEGRLVTRQQLLAEIWGSAHVTDTGYLRLYLSQLRRKLEPDSAVGAVPRHLITEPGMGYRFQR